MIDIKNYLRPYCPAIVNLIGRDDCKFWTNLNNRSSTRIKHLNTKFSEVGPFSFATTFVDLLGKTLQGDKYAEAFMCFTDQILCKLTKILPRSFHVKLRKSTKNLLLNFGNETSNYMDYIGEHCFLEYVLTHPGLQWQLTGIEERLKPNSDWEKTADFTFLKPDNQSIMFDVVSIHVKSGFLETPEDAFTFFKKRMQDKYNAKLGDPPIQPVYEFIVVPVLICDLDEMKKFEAFFADVARLPVNETIPFFSLAQYFNEFGKLEFEFHTLSSLLSRLTSESV